MNTPHIDVFPLPLWVLALRNSSMPSGNVPRQNHLCGRHSILGSKFLDGGVIADSVVACQLIGRRTPVSEVNLPVGA